MPSQDVGPTAKRRRNQRGEGARLRDEVIEAAMRILDRAPATELSFRLVAREAGVAAPSLYLIFADADAMMKDIMRECWRQLGAAMAEAGLRVADEPPLRQLQTQMGAYVRYAMMRPSRYQLLFAPGVSLEAEQEGPLRPASGIARSLIERHHAAGGIIPGADPLAATVLTLSLAHGRIALAHLAPARPSNSPEEVEAFVREALGRVFG